MAEPEDNSPSRDPMEQHSVNPCSALALLSPLAGLMGVMGDACAQSHMPIRLVDVGAEAGVTLLNVCGGPEKDLLLKIAGSGAAFFDYDNDGDMDLLLVNGSTFENLRQGGDPMLALYLNDGAGEFSEVTRQSGLHKKGWGMGVCVADYDNDGFQDFYVTAYGPNALFRNNGDGSFSDVTAAAGAGDARWSTNCAFGDYDRDGDVDLYVANYVFQDEKTTPRPGLSSFCQYRGMDVLCGPQGLPGEPDVLYRNNADGTFTDMTQPAGIVDPGYYGFGVIFRDLNNDDWPDIYVANDSNPNFLFRNNQNATFSEVALEAGAALSANGAAQASMGLDAADYDNDGDMDLFVTNFSQDTNTLYQNNGDGSFDVVTHAAGLGESSMSYLGWGTSFVELDNDGFLDLLVANGHIYPEIDHFLLGSTFLQPNQLYRNLGNGRFQEVTAEMGESLLMEKSSRGVAFGDYDNDGDLDILITNLDDRPNLLRNDSGNKKHWLTVQLVGTKSNRDGIGARIAVRVAQRTQIAEVESGGSYLSHSDSRIHFGLGDATRVEHLEVRWPSGLIETFENLEADQFLCLREGEGMGSRRVSHSTEEK